MKLAGWRGIRAGALSAVNWAMLHTESSDQLPEPHWELPFLSQKAVTAESNLSTMLSRKTLDTNAHNLYKLPRSKWSGKLGVFVWSVDLGTQKQSWMNVAGQQWKLNRHNRGIQKFMCSIDNDDRYCSSSPSLTKSKLKIFRRNRMQEDWMNRRKYFITQLWNLLPAAIAMVANFFF